MSFLAIPPHPRPVETKIDIRPLVQSHIRPFKEKGPELVRNMARSTISKVENGKKQVFPAVLHN